MCAGPAPLALVSFGHKTDLMKATDLQREFTSRAVLYTGGLLLLAPEDASELVQRAAQAGIPVLGVDGMFLRERGTESPVEHIADFSAAVAQGDGCWGPADTFINERRSLGMVFEVVLAESHLPAA